MCAGFLITSNVPVVTGLDVADVDGRGESIGVKSTAGCSVVLSSGDICLGLSLVVLALVATLGAFSHLGFLVFLRGDIAFGEGGFKSDSLPERVEPTGRSSSWSS